MDKQFDKLKSWLLFELICTVGVMTLLATTYAYPPPEMSLHHEFKLWMSVGGMVLILRILFLGRAWFSFLPDNDDPTPVTRSKFEPKVFEPVDDED